MKLRILFVDDEPAVLEALSRVLRRQRSAWVVDLAPNWQIARAVMQETPPDVVVTNLYGPGGDGLSFLDEVRASTSAVRVLLTGECVRKDGIRAAGIVHQVLTKPCSASELIATLERIHTYLQLIPDGPDRQALAKLSALPLNVHRHRELLSALDDPEASLTEISQHVSRDVGLCSKVLQLANSSFFGGRTVTPSPVRAIGRIGLENLRSVLLADTLLEFFRYEVRSDFSFDAFHAHSVLTARIAAELFGKDEGREDLLLAALVHDIGKLALASVGRALWEPHHAEVGAFLLGSWGLPATVVLGVESHHRPHEGLPRAVHIASAIAHFLHSGDDLVLHLSPEFLENGRPGGEFSGWLARARTVVAG